MTREYYSNGKLLLSGEYLVLYGASALVLPLKMGQVLNVTDTGVEQDPIIRWHSTIMGTPWFNAEIRLSRWEIANTTNQRIALKLIRLLKEAGSMNELLFNPPVSFDITSDTAFDMEWGFGSSAALVANIAQWAKVDPFELNFRTFGGSGADVAAAISSGPVVYRLIREKPVYYRIKFNPSFYDHLWIVYSGHKQDTSSSVRQFRLSPSISQRKIRMIDDCTQDIIRSDDLNTFINLIKEHEHILEEILQKPGIGMSFFGDFNGGVKSLGAWGGDFILAASPDSDTQVINYFETRGFQPVFSLKEIAI
jgi:mevalonate kinase